MAEVQQMPYGVAGAARLVGVDDGVAVAGVESATTTWTPGGRETVAASSRWISMMTMTPSTASSPRREKAPFTSSWVGTATGSSVTA